MGNFVNNRKEGRGTMEFNETSEYERYEGLWNSDEFDGIGELFWKNGSKYEGNFRKGLRQGFGMFSTPLQEFTYHEIGLIGSSKYVLML